MEVLPQLSRREVSSEIFRRTFNDRSEVGYFGNIYGWHFFGTGLQAAEPYLIEYKLRAAEVDFKLPILPGYTVFAPLNVSKLPRVEVRLYGGAANADSYNYLGAVRLLVGRRADDEAILPADNFVDMFRTLDYKGGEVALPIIRGPMATRVALLRFHTQRFCLKGSPGVATAARTKASNRSNGMGKATTQLKLHQSGQLVVNSKFVFVGF